MCSVALLSYFKGSGSVAIFFNALIRASGLRQSFTAVASARYSRSLETASCKILAMKGAIHARRTAAMINPMAYKRLNFGV